MKTGISNIIKGIVFLLIFGLLLGCVSRILCPKWIDGTNETYVTEGFYDLDRDSLDVFLVGNSQIIFGLNAMKMYDDYGISAYSLATGSQPAMISYYWLKEAAKTQDFSTVVMDVSSLYGEKKNFSYRKSLDSMAFGMNKLQAVWDYGKIMGMSEVAGGLFHILEYHDRWKELTEQDFNYRNHQAVYVHRGNVLNAQVGIQGLTYEDIMIDEDEADDSVIMENDRKYFRKIIEYCQENEINLVLIKTPRNNWSMTRHNQVQELLDEYGLTFTDFCTDEMLQEIGFDYKQDMKNAEHLNTRGADKVTDWLCKYLLEQFEFEDVRENEAFKPGDIERYHEDHQDVYMKSGKNVTEALEYLADERYDAVLWSTGDISGAWSRERQDCLETIGIKTDLAELGGKSYVFTVHGGTCVDELVTEGVAAYNGTFSDGRAFAVAGNVNAENGSAGITIDGQELAYEKTGMNLLVYDNEKGEIVDTVSFFLSGDTLKMVHR